MFQPASRTKFSYNSCYLHIHCVAVMAFLKCVIGTTAGNGGKIESNMSDGAHTVARYICVLC